MKKTYSGLNDKRHFCGKMAPNLFFLLETVMVFELAWVAIRLLAYLGVDLSFGVVAIVAFVGILAINQFWQDRRRVLNRQKGRCPEKS